MNPFINLNKIYKYSWVILIGLFLIPTSSSFASVHCFASTCEAWTCINDSCGTSGQFMNAIAGDKVSLVTVTSDFDQAKKITAGNTNVDSWTLKGNNQIDFYLPNNIKTGLAFTNVYDSDGDLIAGGNIVIIEKPTSPPQPSCPVNSTLSGSTCLCNEGYSSSGGACITYTQDCQNKYGINSYGNKYSCICVNGYSMFNNQCVTIAEYCKLSYGSHTLVKTINNITHCDCEGGYVWNSNMTACIQIEAKTAIPLPAIKPTLSPAIKSVVQTNSNPKKEIPKNVKSEEKPIIKIEPTINIGSSPSTSENVSVLKEETKNESNQGFFSWLFGSIKNFFSKIFK